jgi:outer membrane protein TolC
MKAAGAGATAAAEKLAGESRLFEAGESTNFLVLTRQNEYSAARRRQVDAESAFRQASTLRPREVEAHAEES